MTRRAIDIEGRTVTATDPGPAPMLQWLPIDRLVIDEAYQRPLGRGNWVSIEKIAANFQWSRFSPVLVAPIEGGRFAVIDGQHRTHAAAICGLTEVPAMVVQVSLEEQSRAFAWVNSQAIKVSTFHVFKAALSAREDWAVRADAAVSAAGCRLMTSNVSSSAKQPGQVFAIALIKRLIESGLDHAVTTGLAAIKAAPSQNRPACYSDFLLAPWIGAVAATGCPSVDVLRAALEVRSPFKVIEAAHFAISAKPKTERARDALAQVITASIMARGAA